MKGQMTNDKWKEMNYLLDEWKCKTNRIHRTRIIHYGGDDKLIKTNEIYKKNIHVKQWSKMANEMLKNINEY